MKLGIIGAMDEEISLLIANMTETKEISIAHSLFIEGKLFGKSVVLLKSGIGKVNAAMTTTIMHERFQPSYVINTGSAGGFSEQLSIGDIVISTYVAHHDVDVTVFGYEYGQVPHLPPVFSADQTLIQIATTAAKNTNIKTTKGIIATGDSFMEDKDRVAFVKEKFPTMIAADMEAAAVAQVNFQYNVPFVVIRALSDIAGETSAVSFEEFLDKAAKNATELIFSMIKSM